MDNSPGPKRVTRDLLDVVGGATSRARVTGSSMAHMSGTMTVTERESSHCDCCTRWSFRVYALGTDRLCVACYWYIQRLLEQTAKDVS